MTFADDFGFKLQLGLWMRRTDIDWMQNMLSNPTGTRFRKHWKISGRKIFEESSHYFCKLISLTKTNNFYMTITVDNYQ